MTTATSIAEQLFPQHVRYIQYIFQNGKAHHAYILESAGQERGQHLLVRVFLQQLFGEDTVMKHHPDVLWYTAQSSERLGMEDARRIITHCSRRPTAANRRVVVIEYMERMTLPAMHALLKCIEEPPGNSFILATTGQIDRILPTIRSRMATLYIPLLSQTVLYNGVLSGQSTPSVLTQSSALTESPFALPPQQQSNQNEQKGKVYQKKNIANDAVTASVEEREKWIDRYPDRLLSVIEGMHEEQFAAWQELRETCRAFLETDSAGRDVYVQQWSKDSERAVTVLPFLLELIRDNFLNSLYSNARKNDTAMLLRRLYMLQSLHRMFHANVQHRLIFDYMSCVL